jgi:predicted cupin superfamily sugar epimerase
MTSRYYISHLDLVPHPEGGYYRETYRSDGTFPAASNEFPSGRNFSTAIYYLLEQGDVSRFHKINSDECWHHYAGDTLLIHIIHPGGEYQCIHLGKHPANGEVFQFVVPAHSWFASEPSAQSEFVLVGCTVSP